MKFNNFFKTIICFVACTAIFSQTTYANSGQYKMKSPGAYELLDGSTLTGVYARGIDLSHWQGDVDWEKVAKDDVKFVMLGTRYKGEIDPKFDYNAREAVKNGIKLGIYIYSYAMTVEEAEAEADFVLSLIKDYPVSYPVAFDVEDTNTQGTLPKNELTAIIKKFTEKIRDAGYYPIIYANDYWITNKLDMQAIKELDVWVARYNVKHSYKNPVMWQATSTGKVDGIKGNVDIDFQYKDYTNIIPKDTWRTINGNYHYYKDFVLQKNTWINDGKNNYYMDKDAKIYKGWLENNKSKYYLDENTGIMSNSWKKISDKWYYFGIDGIMKTGWINDTGVWYFLDNYGIMSTGWLTQGNKKYFLNNSGAMVKGFNKIDNNSYFFDESGEMKSGWINTDSNWYYASKDGIIQTGIIELSGVKYYLEENGRMKSNERVEISGEIYDISSDGAMKQFVPEAQTQAETAATQATETKAEEIPAPNSEVNLGVAPKNQSNNTKGPGI